MLPDGYKDKVINTNQIGGIETYTCNDGAANGSRVAWFNTGSGLRFKVAIDRGLDIVEAFYKNSSLAWLSHNGLTSPRPDITEGVEWITNFPGGLLSTCGLSHIGGPEENENGTFPLHDRYSNLPAELESVIRPDHLSDSLEMSISGIVRQSRLFGPNLELRRKISCELGSSVIKISDVVTNKGNSVTPSMILYHCNFGWPLIDEGTRIIYNGECSPRGGSGDDAIFNKNGNAKVCRELLQEHSGSGEAVGCIDPVADANGDCQAGLCNEKLGMAVLLKFKKEQLPCLTNWQHWGRGEYICGVEPGTNFPIGQTAAKEKGSLIELAPLESKMFELEISVLDDPDQLRKL